MAWASSRRLAAYRQHAEIDCLALVGAPSETPAWLAGIWRPRMGRRDHTFVRGLRLWIGLRCAFGIWGRETAVAPGVNPRRRGGNWPTEQRRRRKELRENVKELR